MAKVDPTRLGKLRGRVHTLCEREGVPPPAFHAEVSPGRGHTTGNWKAPRWLAGKPTAPKITLILGYDEADADVVLQHEVAHHVAAHRYGQSVHHDRRFWRIAWAIFQRENVADEQLMRELRYRHAAVEVAYEVGIDPALIARATEERAQTPPANLRTDLAVIGANARAIGAGDTVRIGDNCRPMYLRGLTGTVEGITGDHVLVNLGQKIGRFGPLMRSPARLLERID